MSTLTMSENRIWAGGHYRIFLSHHHRIKNDAMALKRHLRMYGVDCFVAHEDIEPTEEWQSKIADALRSTNALIAMLTEDFHGSFWTDQEIGYALGREIPVFSIQMGQDPYGFIGKYQALSHPDPATKPSTAFSISTRWEWEHKSFEIIEAIFKIDHANIINPYIGTVKSCGSYDTGNNLARVLPLIKTLSDQQVDDLVAAYNGNSQVWGSFGFNGSRYGRGLAYHLKRSAPSKKFTLRD